MSDREKSSDDARQDNGGNVHNGVNEIKELSNNKGTSSGYKPDINGGTQLKSRVSARSSRRRFVVVVFSLVVLGLLLGASGYWALNLRGNPAPEPEPTSPAESTAIVPPVETKPEFVCPLCGAPLERMPTTRPLAVMIDNLASARPPSGLHEADLVYEAPAEGGVSRLMPVFYHQRPGKIGPIRSARPYFITLAQEYKAVYVHCGGSSDALQQLANKSIASINEFGASKYFWRSTQRSEPHNLYSSSEQLEKAAKDRGIDASVKLTARQFLQPDAVPEGGVPAESLNITYGISSNDVKYTYDASEKVYQRFNGGQPHKDADSGRQLSAANVVVQYVSGRVLDAEGRLQLGVIGSGKAVIYSRGQKVDATWSKSSAEGRTVYKNQQGSEIAFAPGTTWVHLVTPNMRVY